MAPSRRSARRPALTSTSNSKSSNSPQPDDAKDGAAKTSSRAVARRVKDEPQDAKMQDDKPPPRKRKPKEKEKEKDHSGALDEPDAAPEEEEDESGVTRCLCGRTDEDLGFMIMCETCKVWQHGFCMNVPEDQVPENYYCEECRPDLHVELLARRRPRHPSVPVGVMGPPHAVRASASRSSRSHSPGVMKAKSPKRRNTMNSRDAAYEEEIARLLAAGEGEGIGQEIVIEEIVIGARRKRKRSGGGDDQPANPKRPRSTSSASDMPIAATLNDVQPPPVPKARPASVGKEPAPPPARSKKRTAAVRKEKELSIETADAPAPVKKHPNQYTYRRMQAEAQERKRAAAEKTADTGYAPPAPRRNAPPRPARSPQPLLTTWALPEYLAHLAHILPSETPRPLDVNAEEEERGVRVKWPGKRMTIGDMTKRVRNIVEFVAREQAGSQERKKRVDALSEARKGNREKGITAMTIHSTDSNNWRPQPTPAAIEAPVGEPTTTSTPVAREMSVEPAADGAEPMAIDVPPTVDGPSLPATRAASPPCAPVEQNGESSTTHTTPHVGALLALPDERVRTPTPAPAPPSDAAWDVRIGPQERTPSTEQMMMDLMNDLFAFQEKFGLGGARNRRRDVAVAERC